MMIFIRNIKFPCDTLGSWLQCFFLVSATFTWLKNHLKAQYKWLILTHVPEFIIRWCNSKLSTYEGYNIGMPREQSIDECYFKGSLF